MRKAFVTGATGFVGSALVARLLRAGWRVAVLARSPTAARALGDVEIVAGDLVRPQVPAHVDAVFHLAANIDAEAEGIDPSGDLESARNALYKIQERWDAIGKVPRERIRELEGKLRSIEEKVRGAVDAQWRRSDPEAEARVAQFRERVEQFEAQAAKARAAGDKRRTEQAEAQAAQWREWLAAAEQALATR